MTTGEPTTLHPAARLLTTRALIDLRLTLTLTLALALALALALTLTLSNMHRWSGRASEYQRLFEPVDIAKWYGKGIHTEGTGHYIDQLDRPGDANKRPGRFNRIDRHVKQASVDEALSKAREYQQNYDSSGGARILRAAQPAQSQRRRWWGA